MSSLMGGKVSGEMGGSEPMSSMLCSGGKKLVAAQIESRALSKESDFDRKATLGGCEVSEGVSVLGFLTCGDGGVHVTVGTLC